jgi:hypothetical protein
MWPDDESITSATFRFVPGLPVTARYVKYQVTNKRIFDCAGLEVLDSIKSEPFDLRLAFPDEAGPVKNLAPADDGSENSGLPSSAPAASERRQRRAEGAARSQAERVAN